jgi:hypothetical protein
MVVDRAIGRIALWVGRATQAAPRLGDINASIE